MKQLDLLFIKQEMGQGVRTSLAVILAEELEVNFSQIEI
jgi:xanthine dehydrogenase molybdopterin-binding subunit B